MSDFHYYMYYRPGTKMGKVDVLSRLSAQEESRMDAKFFEKGQLLKVEENEKDDKGTADDIELNGIDISKWDKHKGLWLVPEGHRLELLRQHYDRQLA